MIKGTYRFFQNGELVGEHENLLTTAGKQTIVRYFSGIEKFICQSIAVGLSGTAANVSDIALGYELDRADIISVGADITNFRSVFKATLTPELVGSIYEVGAFTVSVNTEDSGFGSKSLFSMSAYESWVGGSFVTTNTREARSLRLNPIASATASADFASTVDLSGYSGVDQFLIAFYVADANCASVTIKLGSDASNYASFVVAAPAAGYQVARMNKSAGTLTGVPIWSSISYIHIDAVAKAGGATIVDIDGMRVENMDSTNQNYALVSHSILAAPVLKKAGIPMDIEYSLTVTA